MNELEVLNRLQSGDVNAKEAYESLYAAKPEKAVKLRKARFLRMKIYLPNESAAINTLLRALFIFPIPVGLISFSVRIANKNDKLNNADIDLKELRALIRYARKTRISIQSEDAIIKISIH